MLKQHTPAHKRDLIEGGRWFYLLLILACVALLALGLVILFGPKGE